MKQLFDGIVKDTCDNKSETQLVEELLEATLHFNTSFYEICTDLREATEMMEVLGELSSFQETIVSCGLDKGLASMAKKNNFDMLFENSSVSLQGFIDGVYETQEVTDVMLNGIKDTGKNAIEKIKKMFAALSAKVRKLISWLTDTWATRAKKALEKINGYKELTKEDWDVLYSKNKRTKIHWDAKGLLDIIGTLSKGKEAFAELDQDKIVPFMESIGWALDPGVYSIQRDKDYQKRSKGKLTFKEAGFNEQTTASVYDAAMGLMTMAISIEQHFERLEEIIKEKIDEASYSSEEEETLDVKKFVLSFTTIGYKYNCYMKYVRDLSEVGNSAISVLRVVNSFKGKGTKK